MARNVGYKSAVTGLFVTALALGTLPGCSKKDSGQTLTGTSHNGDRKSVV